LYKRPGGPVGVIEQSVFGYRRRTKGAQGSFCRTALAPSGLIIATLARMFAADLLQIQQNEIFGSI
jgi:hypothetical protein